MSAHLVAIVDILGVERGEFGAVLVVDLDTCLRRCADIGHSTRRLRVVGSWGRDSHPPLRLFTPGAKWLMALILGPKEGFYTMPVCATAAVPFVTDGLCRKATGECVRDWRKKFGISDTL